MNAVTLSTNHYWTKFMKNTKYQHSLDQKEYLIDKIEHYDLLLLNNKVPTLNELIEEERFKCSRQLQRLREVDMEATLMASASASVFHSTSFIC